MATTLNDNIYVSGQKHVDGKRLRPNDTPWTSAEEVILSIEVGDRAESQEFYIVDKLWWFKGGVEDENLVEKLEGGTGELISKFTSNPIPSIVGTDILVPEDETWLIDSIPYTNPTVSTIPFSYAPDGLLYFLTVVATKFNTFIGKFGTASTDPSEPIINNDELFLTTYLISDGTIEVIIPPVNPNIYVEKESFAPLTLISSGHIASIELDKRNNIIFSGNITKTGNVIKNNSNHFVVGLPFTTTNKTANPIEIQHLNTSGGSGSIAYFNPEELSYFLQPNEVAIWVSEILNGQKIHRRVGKLYLSSETIEFTQTTANLKNRAVSLNKHADFPPTTLLGNLLGEFGAPQYLDREVLKDFLGVNEKTQKGGYEGTSEDLNQAIFDVQLEIDAIQAILASDDINLDTLQEIIAAIKDIDTYLSTILVNDLTSGGTTKALTAEMGKTLKLALDALALVVADKQATLTDTNFGTFTNSVTDKNMQSDTDVFAYVDVTSGKWVKQTFSKLVDYLKGFFVDKTTAQSIDGIKTFTASPIVPTATSDNHAINFGQAKGLGKMHAILIDNNIGDIVQHTGTTMATIVKSYTIPAGFFTSDCVFETDLTITKIGTSGNILIGFGIAPSGTTLPIHSVNANAASQYVSIGRKMTMIKNGLIVGFGNSGVFYTDKIANGALMNKASTFNHTISNTFNLSISLGNASDIALLENLTIKVYKNA